MRPGTPGARLAWKLGNIPPSVDETGMTIGGQQQGAGADAEQTTTTSVDQTRKGTVEAQMRPNPQVGTAKKKKGQHQPCNRGGSGGGPCRAKSRDFGPTPCPNACSNNGYCYGGVCICRPDHEGLDCSVPRDAEPGKVAACAVGCSSKCIDQAHDGGVHQYDDCSKKCFRECVDNLPIDSGPTDCSENGGPCGETQESKPVATDLIQRSPPSKTSKSDLENPTLLEGSFLEQFELSGQQSPHLRNRKTQTKQRSFWDW